MDYSWRRNCCSKNELIFTNFSLSLLVCELQFNIKKALETAGFKNVNLDWCQLRCWE